MEGRVLFRVQHFQQGAGGVAVVGVLCHLVYLVQDEDGVRRAGLLDVLDDAARHGTDVGAAVTANLSLVVQSAQRHPDVFALQRVGNRLAQRRLAHARRSVEAENGAFQVAAQRQHGNVLQDALLHLLHAVVVAVQYALCALQVQVVLRVFAPGQPHQRLQVGQLYVVVGRVGVHLVQFLHLLAEVLGYLVGPFLLLGLLQQFFLLRRALVAHLCLQVLDLLLQEVVALLLVDVVARLVADVQFQTLQVHLAVDDAHRVEQSLLEAVHLQQGHLLLDAERHVRADEVQRHDVVGHVLDGKRGLVGYLVAHVDVLRGLVAQVLDARLELHVVHVREILRGADGVAHHIGLVFLYFLQPEASHSLYDGRDVAVGHGQRLQHLAVDAVVVEVGTYGGLHLTVALAHHAYQSVLFLGLADERHARLAAYQYRCHHTGEHHHVAQSQNGQRARCLLVRQVAVVAVYIGYH